MHRATTSDPLPGAPLRRLPEPGFLPPGESRGKPSRALLRRRVRCQPAWTEARLHKVITARTAKAHSPTTPPLQLVSIVLHSIAEEDVQPHSADRARAT